MASGPTRQKLLLASNNDGKQRELVSLLADLPIDVLRPSELGLSLDVDENGATLAENSRLKAIAFCQASGLPTLADDSGLEILAFHGWPGVYSARIAGPNATDQDRTRLVLARLAGVPTAGRSARFVSVIALAVHNKILAEATGTLEGTLAEAVRGTGGFGYDPIFVPSGFRRTLGELTPAEKNRISHRARALAELLPHLLEISLPN